MPFEAMHRTDTPPPSRSGLADPTLCRPDGVKAAIHLAPHGMEKTPTPFWRVQASGPGHTLFSLAAATLIFLGRRARYAVKRSCKAGLRGELGIERDFRNWQFAGRQFHHSIR